MGFKLFFMYFNYAVCISVVFPLVKPVLSDYYVA